MLKETGYLEEGTYTAPGRFIKEGVEVTVPAENYVVMGDNRSHSFDSREYGFIPKESILGKLWFCYSNCK
jgi:signal peptidase I